MKKHIFGLAIFSFIVFAAAFICGLFAFSNVDEKVSVPLNFPAEKTHCDFGRERFESDFVSSSTAQAVYSVKTKTLMWQGTLPNEKKATHFNLWTRNRVNFTFIGSIAVENMAGGEVYISNELSKSLDKAIPADSLYMIGADKRNGEFEFNVDNAVPVTINYGE